MLELICHHTYDTWQGQPVDRSPYGLSNGDPHGTRFDQDGATEGSGSLYFGPGSRVAVTVSRAWENLGALRVEMALRPDRPPTVLRRRTLIEGDGSFRLVVTASVADNMALLQAQIDDPEASSGYRSVVSRQVPSPGRWATVGFAYDGLATLQLLINGRVVGEGRVSAPLRPVGPRGVAIGGTTEAGQSFSALASVDEVKVWRRDPDAMRRKFVDRVMEPGAADCWAKAFQALLDSWAADPQRAAHDQHRAASIIALIRARIAETGPAGVDEYLTLHREYARLWAAGALDTDEMSSALGAIVAWWRDRAGVEIWRDPDLLGAIRGLDPAPPGVDASCDPVLQNFLTRVLDVVRS